MARSPARGRRAPRAAAPRRARRSARRCRPSRPRSRCAGRPGGLGKRAGEVTSRVWIWPVRRPSRTTRLRRTPPRARGRRRGSPSAAPSRGPRCGRRCRRSEASRQSSTSTIRSQRPRAWKPSDRLARRARRRSTRACCGSATARPPATIGSSSKPSRPPIRAQRLVDLLLLVGELALVGEALPGRRPGRARRRGRSGRRSGRPPARSSSTVARLGEALLRLA